MTYGIVEDNGYISVVEKRFQSLADAVGKIPKDYMAALVSLPDNAVVGAYYIDGVLTNRPAGKERKTRI